MENRNTKPMTETEYRKQIDKIRKDRKDREVQETLDQVADAHFRKKVVPRHKNPPRPRPAVRYAQPQPPPLRGLLAPEPTETGFMSLLTTSPKGSKG